MENDDANLVKKIINNLIIQLDGTVIRADTYDKKSGCFKEAATGAVFSIKELKNGRAYVQERLF